MKIRLLLLKVPPSQPSPRGEGVNHPAMRDKKGGNLQFE
jgi:hypothetical protein